MEKKHIVNKFDKKLISSLPRVIFEGKIIIVLTEDVAEKAVEYLLTQSILGIDTETRPCFTKGKHYKVALLQVATYDTCFLFRLNHLGDSPAIKRLLEDITIPKIGLSLHDDINSLSKRITFKKGWFIDSRILLWSSTGKRYLMVSTSILMTTNFSRCWAPPAAAKPPRCGSLAAF